MDIVIDIVLSILFDVVLGGRFGSRGRRGGRGRRSSPLVTIIILLLVFMCICIFVFLASVGTGTTGNTIVTPAS